MPKAKFDPKPPQDPAQLLIRSRERDEARQIKLDKLAKSHKIARANREIDRWEAQIPRKSRGFTLLDDMDDKWGGNLSSTSIRKISKWAKEPTGTLLLSGGEGTGKTTLAATIVGDWVFDNGENIKNSPMFFLTNRLLSAFSFLGAEALEVRDRAAVADILVLDDLGAGAEGMSAHQKKMLWELINERWSEERPMIITTNMALNGNEDGFGISELLGDSAWARLVDDMISVEVEGTSFRKK